MDVTEKLTPNAKLRWYREIRGWSQEQVGLAVGTDAKRVGVWERGENVPSPYFRHKLCALFGKDAVELGFLAEQDTAALPAPQQPPEATEHAHPAPGLSHTQRLDLDGGSLHISIHLHRHETSPTSTSAEEHGIVTLRTDGLRQVYPREREDAVNRHEFFDKAVLLSGAVLLKIPGDPVHAELVERFSSALHKPSTLDAVTLGGLKATTQSYRRLFAGGSVPSPYLLEAAAGHFKLIVQFLKGSLLPTTRTALSAIAGDTAQFVGRLSVDMHLYEQAESYLDLALAIGQEANNDTLHATVLRTISWLRSLTSRSEEAIVCLEEAQRIATHCGAFPLVCFLAAEQAEAHADLAVQNNAEQPDDRSCLRLLETVHTFVERIQPEEEAFGILFNSSRLVAYQGSCYMRLRQPHLARPTLLSALNMPEPAIFTRAILLDLATTSIQEQEIEQACSYIHQSLALILQAHDMRLLHRVLRLREQLEPWAELQAVKEVDERLRHFNSDR